MMHDEVSEAHRWCFGGALVLCIKPTSWLPVLQIPILPDANGSKRRLGVLLDEPLGTSPMQA